MTQDFLQVFDIGHGVENLLKLVKESGRIQFDGTEDFESIALANGWNLRLNSYPGPGLIEGRVLAKRCLVPKEEGGPFPSGFFLTSGKR